MGADIDATRTGESDRATLTGDDRAVLVMALERVAIGDRRALELIYRRTSTKLFGVCLRILSDRHHAEEALQDAYLSIWRRADAFDPARGTAMTWLITLARNAAIDRRRALVRTAAEPLAADFDLADPAPDALAGAQANDDARRLHGCLAGLNETDRRCIAGAFFEGSSYSALATRAGLPLPTVKSRIRRALVKLRECLA